MMPKCTKEIRKLCPNNGYCEICGDCIGVKRYRLCPHCPVEVRELFREIFTVLTVIDEL